MDEIIFERKNNKVVFPNDDYEFEVDESEIALSVLGGNHIPNKSKIEGDYIHCQDGTRKKFFVQFAHDYFDQPLRIQKNKLNKEFLPKIEEMRWKIHQKKSEILTEKFNTLLKTFPTEKFAGFNKKNNYSYFFTKHNDGTWSISLTLKDEEIQGLPIHQEWTDAYFEYTNLCNLWWKRLMVFHQAFLKLVKHNFRENFGKNKEKVLCLVINDRSYWFEWNEKRFEPKLFCSPEETLVEVVKF